MRAIYKRELRSYFHSMIGYVFIAFLVAYTGIYFLAYNLNYGYPYFSYVLSGILFVYLVAIPILTMRCFAEDKKNKTDQMLLTAPVSLFEIVLGKYLAMVTITAVPCVIYLIFPLIIFPLFALVIKDPVLLGVVFILTIMPCASNSVLFATNYNNDEALAARTVFISTLCSLITIPGLVMLCLV